MNSGLIWFLCLVIPVTYLSYRIIPGYLNYRHNPIWRAAQLRMLSVGQVKRNILTPDNKEGHIIFVVKAFKTRKRLIGKGEKITHIISDTYYYKDGKYHIDIQDREDTVESFFLSTDPEPVYKNERLD